MAWRRLKGLAAMETTDGYTGNQVRVQGDNEKGRVLMTATTTSTIILSPDAARHLASVLVETADDAEKEFPNV